MKNVKYVFRKKRYRLLMTAVDFLGGIIFRVRRKVECLSPRRIVVFRLDSIGDIVTSFPFLSGLRKSFPDAKITLITTTAGRMIFDRCKEFDRIFVHDVPWFSVNRPLGSGLRALMALYGRVREESPDWVIEMRGDVRHIVAARCAAPGAMISGYGITGGAFLLDRMPEYRQGLHAAIRNMRFLNAEAQELECVDHTAIASEPLPEELQKKMVQRPSLKVALHPGAGKPSKLWPAFYWKEVVEYLSEEFLCDFFWIGDKESGRIGTTFEPNIAKGTITNLCGSLSLPQLGTFLGACDLLISTDSGPAHIAATRRIPEVIIFSQANNPSEWAPLNDDAKILTYSVPCAFCGRNRCSLSRHVCMQNIKPSEVVRAASAMLRAKVAS